MSYRHIDEYFNGAFKFTQETAELVLQKNNELLRSNQQVYNFDDPLLLNDQSSSALMVTNFTQTLGQLFARNHEILVNLQNYILKELSCWKSGQKLASNGEPFNNNLDKIQTWFRAQYNLICRNIKQIRNTLAIIGKVNKTDVNALFSQLVELNQNLLKQLVQTALVIEDQPSQVIKKDTKFYTKCRFLLGEKTCALEVTVDILSQEQLRNILEKWPNEGLRHVRQANAGSITNNKAKLVHLPNLDQVAAIFKDQKISSIQRSSRNGCETVMDEKCYLIYQTNVPINGGEFVIPVWTVSLPVVVIVHEISQAPQAWAVITWDNAFRQPDIIFQVPEEVAWNNLKHTLSRKFSKFTCTDCELNEDHLRYLAKKAFGAKPYSEDSKLTWSQFCKEHLNGHNFTFWEWFFAAMKLTRDYLKEPWRDGLIKGFMFRNVAEELLSTADEGTFILRFSDSEPGSLAVVLSGSSSVYSSRIFPSDKFKGLSIAENISLCKDLVTLYEKNCSAKIFERYLSNPGKPQPGNGYVRAKVQFNILPDVQDNLPSPQYSMMSSPCTSCNTDNELHAQSIDNKLKSNPNVSPIRNFWSGFSCTENSCSASNIPPTTNKNEYMSMEECNNHLTLKGFNNSKLYPGQTNNNVYMSMEICDNVTFSPLHPLSASSESAVAGSAQNNYSKHISSHVNNNGYMTMEACNNYLTSNSLNDSEKSLESTGIATAHSVGNSSLKNYNLSSLNTLLSQNLLNSTYALSTIGPKNAVLPQNHNLSDCNPGSVNPSNYYDSKSLVGSPINPLSISTVISTERASELQNYNLEDYSPISTSSGISSISVSLPVSENVNSENYCIIGSGNTIPTNLQTKHHTEYEINFNSNLNNLDPCGDKANVDVDLGDINLDNLFDFSIEEINDIEKSLY